MCGRFTQRYSWSEVVAFLRLTDTGRNLRARYNIAPTDDVLAVRLNVAGKREAVDLRWGLIPRWAKDEKIGYSTINARAETVANKPVFRDAFEKRRCLIVADGYYEWEKVGPKAKQPYRFTLKPERLFVFAGLWERWERPGRVIESCTIIVTEGNALAKRIHDRMPVILDPADHDRWLDVSAGAELLRPYPAEKMTCYPVAKGVGNVKNQGPELIEPIDLPATRQGDLP
jgi:putative SOS response-associated peptidase YedK